MKSAPSKKSLFSVLFFSLFSCLFALPGVTKKIPDLSGQFVYYEDKSFERESYFGIIFYDEGTYGLRYFAPSKTDVNPLLPKKDIQILFSLDITKKYVELTGERIISAITPEDTDIINYLHDMLIAQRYAILNRHIIASMILSRLGINAISEWETVHNYIDLESNILRKGAVSAKAGEKLLIPINMKEGSLICIGKGNKSWNYSAPHGAGRLMSRAQARNTLSVEEFKQSMSNIYSSTVCESTLDEAPMAYKPIEVITNDIKETVDVVTRIKPIYNYKATN